jgi:hypothetical protein
MRKIRFTEHQIIAVLKSVEAGRTVKDVCREAAINDKKTHRIYCLEGLNLRRKRPRRNVTAMQCNAMQCNASSAAAGAKSCRSVLEYGF